MNRKQPRRLLLVALGVTLALSSGAITGTVATLADTPTPAYASPITPTFGPTIEAYAPNDPQDTCDPTAKPGVVEFKNLLHDTYGSHSYGIGRECSAGGTSEHKEGRALDYMLNVNNAADKAVAEDILNWLLATDSHGNQHAIARRLGIMYLIWNKQVWSAARHAEGWRAYSGDSDHTDHIHFSFSWDGALQQTSWWTSGAAFAPGTAIMGDLGLLSTPANLIAIHRKGSDNGVWGVSQVAAGGAYGAWTKIGTQTTASNPATLVATNGSIVSFVRGTDNKIYGVSQLAAGGAYGSWGQVGSGQPTFTGDPTAVLAANGSIVVYATGTDGKVWGLSQLAPGGAYGSWGQVGSGQPTIASSPAILRSSAGLLVVAARGTDNKIYAVSQGAVGGAYGSWGQLGSGQSTYTGDPSVAVAANGSIVIYATGTDGKLWGLSQLAPGGAYGTWTQFGTSPALASNPSTLRASTGVLAAFARGTDGKVYGVSQLAVGGAYGSWGQVGSGQPTFIGDPSAFVAPNGGITLVARATDGYVWGVSQSGPNGAYSSWSRIGS